MEIRPVGTACRARPPPWQTSRPLRIGNRLPVGRTLQHLYHQFTRVELSNRGHQTLAFALERFAANKGVTSVVDLLTLAVGWAAVGTPGRRCTIDPPDEPVEATMPHHQLGEAKR
ncbi:unnamed protein product [Macrosiphum euphorbiae]|uniref:Uncharacterized protein n=1 Tax=Macrosiphum euphorbiae TaxID=13131 RepID=A0AAV0VS10_9HEMI|nr:unnamed protein product [Macrosiphum euphorbiae]